ncbi:distal tail protein Dit [Lacticaseibacillus paracasei]|uniref:distal tail protein Dit n=1 Tax=Lacticaseibacillus paracasei TaxID=1597 RepID=UPI001F511CDC|nr:distal tail protein Dit [Lacticaseibacillus paracasei]MCI0372916.1 phage tail family protein [Lacticaseibacillus paracasei]MCI0374988.1 phage tail family protein [Lacticaseibacillus paracasei]
MKKEITVNYGGLDLSPYFIVSNVTMPFLYKDNQYTQIGRSDGESLIYSRNAKTKITIQGTILTQETNLTVAETKDELINALKSDTIQQLTLSNYPGRYFNAIFDGSQDFDGTFDYIATVELVFTVPDGIAHSVATQTADNMPYKDVPVNLLTGTSADPVSVTGSGWNIKEIGSYNNPTIGKKYAATVLLGQADFAVSFQMWANDINGNRIKLDGFPVTTQMGANTRSTIVCTWPDPGTTGAAQIEVTLAWAFQKTDVGTYQYLKAKLEEGTTYSTWSPNPADAAYYSDTITVHNGGTYPVEPVITATMHADNGLIALINSQGGVLQFGNPEEADGVERKRSEVARYEGFDKEPVGAAYNTGQTNSHYYYIAAQKNVMEGSVKYADDDGSAVEPVFLPTNSYYWEGPSLHLKTTNASNGSNTGSFIAKWRYKFNSSVNALGAIEMTLDNDTGVAYQVIIRSNYAGKDDVDVQVFAGSTLVFQQTLNRSVFSNGRYYEAKLTKLGNTLNLQLAGIVQGGIKPSEVVTRNTPLIMPPIMLTSAQTSLPITGATLWFQRFENYPYPDMGVYDMDIEWLNVDYWTDLSNRFSAGDVATIDVANRQILVNGVINADLQLIDNDWKKFKLLPGDTQILTQRSSWAQPYEVEVALREAFL